MMKRSFKAVAGLMSILMLAATMSMTAGQAAQADGKSAGRTGLEPVVTAVIADTATNTPVSFTPETTSYGLNLSFCLPAASDRGCDNARGNHTRAVVLEVRGEGSWVLDPSTGEVTFTPVATFTGKTKEVTYEATDAYGTGSAKIAVRVGKPVAPSISATLGTTFFNTPTTVLPAVTGGVIINSSACLVTDNGCAKEIYNAGEGTWTINRNRSVTFTPETDFAGTATQVNYRIADAFGQATIGAILMVVSNPEAPQLANSLVSTSFDTSATFEPEVITNSEVNKDKTCLMNPIDNLCAKQVKVRGEGIWSVNSQGKVSFKPDSTYSGTTTPVEVRVSDKYKHNGGKCKNIDNCSAQVGRGFSQVRVRGPKSDLSPDKVVVSEETEFNTSVKFTPVINGAVAGSRLGTCVIDPRDGICKSLVLIENKGTWSVNSSTGEITFDPISSFAGQTSPIEYRSSDKYGRNTKGLVKVNVRGPKGPKLGANDVLTPINTPVDFSPTIEGKNVDYSTACLVDPITDDCASVVVIAGQGTFSISGSNGMVNFTPEEGFVGATKSVTYQVTSVHGSKKLCSNKSSDSHGRYNNGEYHDNQSSQPEATYSCFQTGSVKLKVGVATGSTLKVYSKIVTTAYNTPITILPRVSGTHIEVGTACLVDPADSVCKTTVEIADRGTFTVNIETREVTFTPLDSFVGQTSAIKYMVANVYGVFSQNWLRFNVSEPDYSVANETWASTKYNTPVLITPTITGSHLSPASACLVDPADSVCKNQVVIAGQGTFTVNNLTGDVDFTPAANFKGLVAAVEYQILDNYGRNNNSCSASPTSGSYHAEDNHNKDGDYEGDDETKHGHEQCNTALTSSLRVIVEDTAAPHVDPISDTTNFNTPITVTPVVTTVANTYVNSAIACLVDPLDSVCKTRVVAPGKGVWTVASGAVTFTPYAFFVGKTAPIVYRAFDNNGNSGQNTVTITVLSRHASVPGSTHKTTAFKTDITFSPNLSVSNPVFATACLVDPTDRQCKTTVVVANQGTWTVNTTNGEVTFSPLGAYVGTTGTLDYKIVDAYGVDVNAAHENDECSAEDPTRYMSSLDDGHYGDHHGDGSHECFETLTNHLSVTVLKPTAPTVDAYTATTNYDTQITLMQPDTTGFNLLTNLFCVVNATDECIVNPDTIVNDDGTWEVAADGTVSFTPASGFTGDAVITFRVIDPFGQTAQNTITVTVKDPDAIVVTDLEDETDYNTPWKGTPTVDGTDIDWTSAYFVKGDNSHVRSLTVAGEGTWDIDTTTGEVTFTPLDTFAGVATAVNYYIEDGYSSNDTGTITITVLKPDAPTVDNISEDTNWNTPKEVTPVTHGFKMDGSKTCFIDPDTTECGTSLVIADEGTWSVDTATGMVKFTPLRGFWGTTTSVTFRVEDGFEQTGTGSAVVDVADPVGPSLTGPSTPTIDYMAKKDDITPTGTAGDGAITGYSFITEAVEKNSIVTSEGVWLIDADTGVISFEAAEGFAGTTASIGIRVTDEFGFTADSTVTVIVNEPLAPAVDPKTVQTAFNTPVTFTPTITGEAIDYSTACVVDVNDANKCKTTVTNSTGTWTVNTTNGAVTFAPANGFTGNSSIVYKISNTFGGTGSGNLTVTVEAAPFATLDGIVWFDLNKNNIQDPDEPGLPGITVTATGATISSMIRVNNSSRASTGGSIQTVAAATAVTDSTGYYTFQVSPGVYTIKATLASNLVRKSFDEDGGTDWSANVTIESVGNSQVNFGAAGDGALTGGVTIGTNAEVPNAIVICMWSGLDGVFGTEDDVDLHGVADSTGHLTFNGLPGGSFDCQGTDPTSGKQSAKKSVVVNVGNSVPVVVALPIAKPRRYVFTVSGFPKGSPKMTKAMQARILKVMKLHPGAKRVSIIGYTMGPTVLKVDYKLSMDRAKAAWVRVKAVDNLSRLISLRSSQVKKKTGSFIRRVTIALYFD